MTTTYEGKLAEQVVEIQASEGNTLTSSLSKVFAATFTPLFDPNNGSGGSARVYAKLSDRTLTVYSTGGNRGTAYVVFRGRL